MSNISSDEPAMNDLRFEAPWSRGLWIVSVGVTVLCLAVSLTLFTQLGVPHHLRELTAAIPIIVVAGTVPFVIRGYRIQGSTLLVERLFWSTKIPLDGLVSATSETRALRGSIRTFGNGGLYSITGWYWSRRLGAFRAFVTDSSRTVILRFAKKTIVVSPAEPDSFVTALGKIAGTGASVTGAEEHALTSR